MALQEEGFHLTADQILLSRSETSYMTGGLWIQDLLCIVWVIIGKFTFLYSLFNVEIASGGSFVHYTVKSIRQ